MEGMIVESVWMLSIIAFMIVLGSIAAYGALRRRAKSDGTPPRDRISPKQ